MPDGRESQYMKTKAVTEMMAILRCFPDNRSLQKVPIFLHAGARAARLDAIRDFPTNEEVTINSPSQEGHWTRVPKRSQGAAIDCPQWMQLNLMSIDDCWSSRVYPAFVEELARAALHPR